mgnify:CR=1 FL=1
MKPRALVVDDDDGVRYTLRGILKRADLEVHEAASGEAALAALAGEATFHLVITDLRMPGMDGLEALARIKRRQPKIQVVLLTGHATLEKGVEAMKRGALEFLEKPIDLSKLSEVIHKAKAEKMILVEEDTEERIREILHEKSW